MVQHVEAVLRTLVFISTWLVSAYVIGGSTNRTIHITAQNGIPWWISTASSRSCISCGRYPLSGQK